MTQEDPLKPRLTGEEMDVAAELIEAGLNGQADKRPGKEGVHPGIEYPPTKTS